MATVYAILQDTWGFMWFATEDGLNRFDGYEFEIFRHDPDDRSSLGSNQTLALHQDVFGYLWIGTNWTGLDRYDPLTGQFQHFRHEPENPNSLSDDTVTSVLVDQQGLVWVGTRQGLNRFDPSRNRWQRYLAQPGQAGQLGSDQIHALYEDPAGGLWIGTGQGLYQYDAVQQSFDAIPSDLRDPVALQDSRVTGIVMDQDGRIWAATFGNGLFRYDPQQGSLQHYAADPERALALSSDNIRAIAFDLHGDLWLATDAGLNRFDSHTGTFTQVHARAYDPASLAGENLLSLFCSPDGGLWVGVAHAGIDYFSPFSAQFDRYQMQPGNVNSLGASGVWSIYQDQDGVLWLGTQEGGLERFDRNRNQWTHYRHDPEDPSSLSHDNVVAVHGSRDGSLWIGTWGGGLNHFDPASGAFRHYRADPQDPDSLLSDTVWLILEDREGILWLGTDSGLDAFDPQQETFTHYVHDSQDPTSLSSNYISALYQDASGRLWVGTYAGLNRYDPQSSSFRAYRYDPRDSDSLSYPIVFAIHEDAAGNLWVGTYGGGLNRFDPVTETFQSYRVSDGLVNDAIYGILEDAHGNLWLSTNGGLSKFDPQREQFWNFDLRDGLQSNEFNFNAYYQNDQGEMFFGGVNGLNAFYPDQIGSNPYLPAVHIRSVSRRGEPVIAAQDLRRLTELELRWPDNYFDFEFVALNYFNPPDNRYAYLLEGFDQDWNANGAMRSGRYTNLPGGTYTLRVKAANNDGLWNETGTALTIKVITPFWEAAWFYILLAFTMLAAGVWGYLWRLGNLEKQQRSLDAQVAERTAEIERRRQHIEALYRADEAIYRHLNLDQVLQALVDNAVEILHADKGALLCWDEAHENLLIRAWHNFDPFTVRNVRIPSGQGVVGKVAETGQPAIVTDTGLDERVTLQITKKEKIRAFIQVPIKIGQQVFGVFSADYLRPRVFSEDDQRLLESLAQRAALAIRNAQMYQNSSEMAAAQERNRLARELHDAVTQTLFSASLIAEALPALWARDPRRGQESLAKLRQMSRGALAEMRALLLELRPAALLDTGLPDLLQQLAEAVMGREDVPVAVSVDGSGRLPKNVHIAYYRIAQEALNNVVKHARASQVQLSLRFVCDVEGELEEAVLEIRDNGRGFDPGQHLPDHMGLVIMQERAASIRAAIVIASQPGQGTQVRLVWPDPETHNRR
ncbi:MAG: GAF domain-containing protein [Anaerolineales bacterium]|nr:GAF domain-containing protein [Anaerolineales bacterium]